MNSCDQSSSAAAAGAIVAAVASEETPRVPAISRLRRESRAGEENGMGDPSGTGRMRPAPGSGMEVAKVVRPRGCVKGTSDRKSTRLNSSHVAISYAVFCLKKKKKGRRLITHACLMEIYMKKEQER